MSFLTIPRRRSFTIVLFIGLLLVIGSMVGHRPAQAADRQQHFFANFQFTQQARQNLDGWLRGKTSTYAAATTAVMPPMFAIFTVTNTNDSGAGSLRQAIDDANLNPGTDTIDFALGAGFPTISPLSTLPTISDPVIMNGNIGGSTLVRIDGASAGAGVSGLTITAGNSTVRRMLINGFKANGIQLITNGGNIIAGCGIGVDSTGTVDLGNGFNGIQIETANNTIGGLTALDRNTISGNDSYGIFIIGASATGNKVIGKSHWC